MNTLSPPELIAAISGSDIKIVDFARQGDVVIIPERMLAIAVEPTTAVAQDGVDLVRREFGGNTHLLIVDGDAWFDPAPATPSPDETNIMSVGVLTVAPEATAYLIHPEHAAVGVAAGRYTVRRQREWSDVVHLVHD